ncbi:hypothetical protein MPSEU_000124400 [Mayamaea pseudoterrestris]|nr:hypothetical protein MPSEU_000124400 [Mayamaea pseudoterrestris]
MNFESLRDLASEARKKHPGVKEASERATLRLRMLQTQYVSKVRQANSSSQASANGSNDAAKTTTTTNHPTTQLFAHSEILHPFLLAANYPNASAELLNISFNSMQLLMRANAVQPSDAIQMLRVWMIQAQNVVSCYEKLYAKEIYLQTESQQHESAAATNHAAGSTTSSSSWFSWGSSSAAATTDPSSSNYKQSSNNQIQSTKSSSTTLSSQQSPLQMEHCAKQILSCLLQLLELLKEHYAKHLTVELWTNAMALACVWLHYTPIKHTVHQAAVSTLKQVMNLLYSAAAANDKLLQSTWDDLLQLCDVNIQANINLTGAFSLCQRSVAHNATVYPPCAELALQLLTRLEREHDVALPPRLLQKTFGISVQLLLQLDKRGTSLEKCLRIAQWTTVLFQKYFVSYSGECLELLELLLKPIAAATDICRSHDDFEDGYVYTASDADIVLLAEQHASSDGKKLSSTRTLTTLIPPSVLWKAVFSLEAIYVIFDRDDPMELSVILEDARIVLALSETLSDFATIGASCMDHLLQFVSFGKSLPFSGNEVFAKSLTKVKPTFFRTAEQACTSGNAQSLLVDGASTDKSTSSPSSGVLGEALWITLQNLLRLPECMIGLNGVEQMLEQTFAPSLAVLQHYLKRCIGSSDLVQLSLKGFANLADVCLPLGTIHRKALLLSLCKLSLPTWGQRDSTAQLQDHHVMTLLYLCRIIHTHYEFIIDDWEIILRTFDELSDISIASKQLSDESYHAALAVSNLFSRLAPFSTCFSSSSLLRLAEALTEITKTRLEGLDVVGSNDTVLAQRTKPVDALARQSSDGGESSSISSKIMNIGVRAIYGNESEIQQKTEGSKGTRIVGTFCGDYRHEYVKRISSAKSTMRVNAVGDIPYVLAVLTDLVMANSFRFEKCGDQLSEQLSRLASISPAVRPFIMDVLSVLAMSHLSSERALPAPFVGPGRSIFEDPMQSQLWAVEECSDKQSSTEGGIQTYEFGAKSQSDLLSPLCLRIQSAEKPDMAESSLGALSTIIEGVGHNMTGDVWCHVIDAVASLSGDPTYTAVDRTHAPWINCSSLAFRCLKFIVDDFRDQLTQSESASKTLTSLLDCCTSFGRSKHDVNISLTAITLLWTIADQDPDSDSVDRALSRLLDLAADVRAEIRNAAVNTLFSCIIGRGSGFTPARWKSCFLDTIFGVYDMVANYAGTDVASGDSGAGSGKRYRVSLHHSRDSSQKQWLETQSLVLRGLIRLLRSYFSLLLDEADHQSMTVTGQPPRTWFEDAWLRILDYSFDAATYEGGRDTLAMRTTGLELMVLCCQLASNDGVEAATAPARVSTNMEVINGALRTVREPQSVKMLEERVLSVSTNDRRKQLYVDAFEAIEAYNEAVSKTISQGGNGDETTVQVIHSFVTSLRHLYDCSMSSELSSDNAKVLHSLDRSEETSGIDVGVGDLEPRFVQIVSDMLKAAGNYSSSRFLNQGQRVSLNLLRTIASNGSAVAFTALVDMAGKSLFVHSSEQADDKGSQTALRNEASDAISQEIVKDTVSCECKSLILYRVLNVFLGHCLADTTNRCRRQLPTVPDR